MSRLAAYDVASAFVVSRLLLVGLTAALGIARHRPFFALWNILDAQWYGGIATHGYAWSVDGKPALAFFPLFPALIHLAIGAGLRAETAGLLLANVFALGALFYLRSLFGRRWDRSTARSGVWLFALFPTSFFTFAPYTESLFILAAAGALYHADRGNMSVAGLWLAVATMTRSTGVILIPALLISVLGRRRRDYFVVFGPAAVAAAIYVLYLSLQGLPLSDIIGSEQRWHRSLTFPWNGFTSSLHYLAYHLTYNAGWTAENLLQLSVTVGFLAATALAWRSLPPPWVLYCLGFWAVVLCTPEWRDGYFAPFSSVDRFVLALFPLAGWAAAQMPPRALRIWLALSATLMVGAAGVHLSGGWIG